MQIKENVIIARISTGLANQMYEIASAYALARELNRELILDISSCCFSAWGYLGDYFNIPSYRKMICVKDVNIQQSHTNPDRMPPGLKSQVSIWLETEWENYIHYKKLEEAFSLETDRPIYLCGYFFDRHSYYEKYWEDIKQLFTLKEDFREIKKFKELIDGKISVGVHIRRGDMLFAEWATVMKDDYYRSAIEYCRKQYRDCIFCVFSDDIEYAKKLLGQDSSIYYVHFNGYDDVALIEFFCLSLCNHRILSNSSTFSRLADELNGYKEGHFFVQATAKGKTELKNHIKRYINEIIKKQPKKRRIIIDKYDIARYSRKYKADGISNIEQYRERMEKVLTTEVTADNAKFILDEICRLSLNTYQGGVDFDLEILFQKFLAQIQYGEFQYALQSCVKLYEKYRDNELFKESLVIALREIGADKEAIVESISLSVDKYQDERLQTVMTDKELRPRLSLPKKKFLIIPSMAMAPSSVITGLFELGMALFHLGHDVSFVFEPINKEEKEWLKNSEHLVNRNGADLGCKWYDIEEVRKKGISSFYQTYGKDDLIVISRKDDFYLKEHPNIKYVFIDFTDPKDSESVESDKIPEKEINNMYRMADLVLTQNKTLQYVSNTVIWEDNGLQEEYWLCGQKWESGYEHRISSRIIDMMAVLIETIRERWFTGGEDEKLFNKGFEVVK